MLERVSCVLKKSQYKTPSLPSTIFAIYKKICVIIYFKRKQWNCINLFYRISSKRSRCKSFFYIYYSPGGLTDLNLLLAQTFFYQGKYLANRNREYIIIFIQTFLFSSSFTVLIESICLKNFLFYGI